MFLRSILSLFSVGLLLASMAQAQPTSGDLACVNNALAYLAIVQLPTDVVDWLAAQKVDIHSFSEGTPLVASKFRQGTFPAGCKQMLEVAGKFVDAVPCVTSLNPGEDKAREIFFNDEKFLTMTTSLAACSLDNSLKKN